MDESNRALARRLSILGSTGSIGTQTLDIVRLFPERFQVVALTGGSNASLLIEQAFQFKPSLVAIGDVAQYKQVAEALAGTGIRVVAGEEGLKEAAAHPEAEVVVAAVVGFAGLAPVLEAIRAGKVIALANKETLVVAGALIQEWIARYKATLIPVDSEHSAIFQCLVGESMDWVESLILTASGGPFRTRPLETFAQITPEEALRHPNWSMGAKITIDSATMMNKGLEVIEAHWLFNIPVERIEVLVHPQSIVHSMVTFRDGSVKAQLGLPDMRIPIQYALTYPERWEAHHPRINWSQLRQLEFEAPDMQRFPCLRLAYQALEAGGVAPAVLNAANEEAVQLFLEGRIGFMDIPRWIEGALEQIPLQEARSLEDLQAVDSRTRQWIRELNPLPTD